MHADAPAIAWYMPATQLEHAPAEVWEYLPGGHRKQVEPDAYCPAAQLMLLMQALAAIEEDKPEAQTAQALAPTVAEYVLAAQEAQLVPPGED